MVDATLQANIASASRPRTGVAPDDGAQVEHCVPDDAAAHPAGRLAGDLSGALFGPPRDAEQVDGAVRRPGKLLLPVQARNILDGGEAVLHLRHHRGDFQSADRLHRRALRPQHPQPGPAQMARHAAGTVGDPAGDEHARLAVAVRSILQRVQLGAGAVQYRPDPVDRRRQLGPLLGDPGQHLDRRAVLHDHVSRRAQIGAGATLRGGRDRRRQLVAAHLVRDACR